MGSLRITLGAGAVVAAALMPTASAADAQGVFLAPASASPGSGVRLSVRGCASATGSAASDAFAGDARLVGRNGLLTGGTRVSATARPGLYSVRVGCDGREVHGVLTVGGPKVSAPSATPQAPTSPAGSASPAASGPSAVPAAPSSPVAPVHAGGGATAPLSSSDARSGGPGVLQAVIGLVLAGVAAVVVIARSIRRGRGRE
ncbi:hypothetical protein [Streptomyces gibsoniae]|uniref:Sortase n=1 Tax=Streptomyces gibsoniae TaxID=3075529 RepID=A0ABU2TNG2_9ACTN|nr:hypothetical protein [Streptomyces sp. DSM 41699]MDT0462486.1 hypothetical protein [Streptomyces sp. DSM 41699]